MRNNDVGELQTVNICRMYKITGTCNQMREYRLCPQLCICVCLGVCVCVCVYVCVNIITICQAIYTDITLKFLTNMLDTMDLFTVKTTCSMSALHLITRLSIIVKHRLLLLKDWWMTTVMPHRCHNLTTLLYSHVILRIVVCALNKCIFYVFIGGAIV